MRDTSDDDVTLVALPALLLDYEIKLREGRKKKRKKQRTGWVKLWISRTDELGAYNALINEMAMTDREDYRRFMHMNTETFNRANWKTSTVYNIAIFETSEIKNSLGPCRKYIRNLLRCEILLVRFTRVNLVPRLFYIKHCMQWHQRDGAQSCQFRFNQNGQRCDTSQKDHLRTYYKNGPFWKFRNFHKKCWAKDWKVLQIPKKFGPQLNFGGGIQKWKK